MERVVKVQAAKAHLSSLLAQVEQGEEIVIARGDRPVARLVPFDRPPNRELGFVAWDLPDSFFEALPEDELVEWKQ
jgi:prevent-host-death family protein